MESELSDEKIDEKIRQRESARASKDFAMSDQIRDELFISDYRNYIII